MSRSAVLWGRECVWSLFLSAARELVRAVESHDDRKMSSREAAIRFVLAAERRRNEAWGFNPRKRRKRRIFSPVRGAGFARFIRIGNP